MHLKPGKIKNISLAHCSVWGFLKGILGRDNKKKKKEKNGLQSFSGSREWHKSRKVKTAHRQETFIVRLPQRRCSC